MLICNCGDIPFDTRSPGALYVENGVVKFDKVKTFNAARRMLNAGANILYINRFALKTWYPPAVIDFDWESPGYFDLLREYCKILHQPIQDETTAPGADIIIDLFLGCVETWQYFDYVKSTRLINAFFTALGDLPYVHFAVGRECNADESRAWVRDCVYPTFKAAGKIPFSYGASYCHAGPKGPMEWQTYEAELVFGYGAMLKGYRKTHNVKDEISLALGDIISGAVYNWCVNGNPICVIFSMDGIWDGLGDSITLPDGRIQARPSTEQIKSALRYILNNSPRKFMNDGQIKYGYECMTKSMTIEAAVKQLQAVAEVYVETFGILPENAGKYPNDWIEPVKPEPEPIPEPIKPKVEPWYSWNRIRNVRKWTWQAWLAFIILIVLAILIFGR